MTSTHSKLLFAGKVAKTRFDNNMKLVEFSVAEDALTYTTVDANCNVRVHSIDDAFASLNSVSLITIATPDNIITNAMLTAKDIIEQKHLFRKPTRQLRLIFTGDKADQRKLTVGEPFQLYGIDNSTPCP
jgi:hypothetical protein